MIGLLVTLLLMGAAVPALGAEGIMVGTVKVAKGNAHLERDGQRPLAVGLRIHVADTIVTGPGGAVGITFADSSLLSIGPNSALVIDRFAFDAVTHAGAFEVTLRHGTLSVVSGKIARQAPDAMTVRTPTGAAISAQGTEFVIRTSP